MLLILIYMNMLR